MKHNYKRFLAMVMAVVMIIGMMPLNVFAAEETTTVYLKPDSSIWATDGAWFAAYYWDGNGSNWAKLTDEDNDGYYEAEIPAGYSNIIFTRNDPAKTDLSWDSKWNQTGDLIIADNNNCFTITGWDNGAGVGAWSHKCVPGEAATCTTGQSCTVCGGMMEEALGHSYVDGFCTRCEADEPWYDADATEYHITDKDELIAFAEAVDNGDTFAGKTVYLDADIDMYEVDENGERVTFNPIGTNSTAVFEGTFDGQNHTIKNLYQNGWALGYEWGTYGSVGLFASVNNATVKNLTIEGTECLVEGGDVSAITGSATGTCVFENITVKDSVIATYNNGCGSIIAWSGAGNYTFKDITIASDVTLAGLWGSFDSSIGGVVGQGEPGATYNFENVDIACRIDAYNDCTASYDYYNYRMCGMIIGRLQKTTTIDGTNYPDMTKYTITCNDVTVTYGDWMNYHYCDPTPGYNNGRGMRVETGYAYDALPADYDHSQCTTNHNALIPFDQLFGGDQYGVKGLPTYEGVTVKYPQVAAIGETTYASIADAVAAAQDGDTITVVADHEIQATVVIDKDVTLDLNSKAVGVNGDIIPAIRVLADVTVTGDGMIDGDTYADSYAFIVGNSDTEGSLTIVDGSYYGDTTVASVTQGTLNIEGGYFEASPYITYNEDGTVAADYGYRYTLNCIDANYEAGTAKINVTGGTFYGFDPADNLAEGEGTNFVAEGYVSNENLAADEGGESTWTVTKVAEPVYVAQIVETGVKYESLQEAMNACTNGETVQLIADITYDADDVVYAHGGATGFGKYDAYNPSIVYIGGTKGATEAENQPSNVNAVLDLNGHTITNDADAYMFLIMDNAKLTFTDSVGTGSVTTTTDAPVIWVTGAETLVTIEKGRYVTASGTGLLHTTHSGDLVITGGDFSTTADDASLLLMLNTQKYNNPNYFLSGVATVTVYGGTFHGFDPEQVGDDYGAKTVEEIKFVDCVPKGYKSVNDAEANTWTVVPNQIFEMHLTDANGEAHWLSPMRSNDINSLIEKSKVWYDSLQGTYSFTLKVLESYELDETVLATFPMTIDLCDNTLTVAEAMSATPAVRVLSDVTVTNGTVDATAGTSTYAFIVGNSTTEGKLTITDGTYKGVTSVASVTKGELNISGGYFEATEYNGAHEFTLNCIDANYTAGTAKINVTGGTFYGFNPDSNAAEGVGTDFVPEEYVSTEADGKWTVTEWDYEIWDKDDLLKLNAIVDGGNMLEGVTVKLMADIDLYEMGEDGEPVSFDPIGENSMYFKGTFDGQNHTIKNLYQSGWALGHNWDNYGTIGLFAYLWDATIKNLTIENAECFVEGGNVAAIAGCAWGDVTFENIKVVNSKFATYNNRAGGIVGYTGGEGTFTFKDIVVDEDTVIASLWGSYDSTLGGVMGQLQEESKAVFENVEVSCRLDAYNDVTASYKWYSYRMCGMLIGRVDTIQQINGTNYPDPAAAGVTVNNVTVNYGTWANHHYLHDSSLSKGCQRVEAGYTYGGVDASAYPDAKIEHITFDQIFGGPQSQKLGYYGLAAYDGVTVNYPDVAAIGETPYDSIAEAVAAAQDGDTITVLVDHEVHATVVINKNVTLDLNGKTVKGCGDFIPVIRVLADVTVTGDGMIDGDTYADSYAFIVGNSETAGKLTIKDGSYIGNTTVASVTKGTLNIEGGYFEASPYTDENGVEYGYRYTLNCIDANYADGSAVISVTGGTFYGFDPDKNLAEGEGTDFVPDGFYQSTENAATEEGREATWTVTEVTDFYIYTKEDLVNFAALVDNAGDNSFAGKTAHLMADIDLYEVDENGERVTFNPIGNNSDAVFDGTFDGHGHTISNMYQSGWALGYEWGKAGYMGLFSYVYNGTVKNLTIENAETFVEGGIIAGIAGCAYGECTFENINIVNSKIATYNSRAAGIVGWAGKGDYTFKNISVDDQTVIAGLWGSFDSTLGGVVGELVADSTASFEDVTVDCRLDAYNDVTASYKWYSYRMCGMLIGRVNTIQQINGTNYPDPAAAGVTVNNVTVNYGDWAHHHYLWNDSLSKGCQRVEAGYTYGGVDVSAYPGSEITYIHFDQIFGGPQSQKDGYYGLAAYDGVTVNYPDVAAIGETRYDSIAEAVEAAQDGDTITVLVDHEVHATVVINKNVTLDLNGKTVKGCGDFIPVIRVLADVTVTGNGTIDGDANSDSYAFIVGNSETAGKLTIKDGSYIGNTTVASVTKGTLNIEDGYFEATPYTDENGVEYGCRYTLNCIDANYNDGSAVISLTGGTYYGFDPENNAAEGEGTNFCAQHYVSVDNGDGTWTVMSAVEAGYVCWNVQTGVYYEKVTAGLQAAENGQTVQLLTSTSDGNVLVFPGLTLDLNGFDLTADYLVGFNTANVIDSQNGTGSLITGIEDVVLDEENAMVPVYNGSAYLLTKVGFALRQDADSTDDCFEIDAMAYPVVMEVVELLKNGGADNNIRIAIRLSWDSAKGESYQEFVFTDDVVAAVYGSNNGTFTGYTQRFSMEITGFEGIQNLKARMVILSDTNATYISSNSVDIT